LTRSLIAYAKALQSALFSIPAGDTP